MYIGEFSPADGSESDLFGFDFRRDLSPGETITAGSFEIRVIDGTDADAASHLSGASAIAGTQVRQRVAGLVPGVTYALEAIAVTSFANTKSLWGRVTCKS